MIAMQVRELISLSAVVKLLVDGFKLAWPNYPSWALVVFGVLAGVAASFLVSLSAGEILSIQASATNVLMGIVAFGTAVGLTEIQKKAEAKRQ